MRSIALALMVGLAAMGAAQDDAFQRVSMVDGPQPYEREVISTDPGMTVAAFLSGRLDLTTGGAPGGHLFVQPFGSAEPLAIAPLPSFVASVATKPYPFSHPRVSADGKSVYLIQDALYRFDIASKSWSYVARLPYTNFPSRYSDDQDYYYISSGLGHWRVLAAAHGHVWVGSPQGDLEDLDESTQTARFVAPDGNQRWVVQAVDPQGTRAIFSTYGSNNEAWSSVSLLSGSVIHSIYGYYDPFHDDQYEISDIQAAVSDDARGVWISHRQGYGYLASGLYFIDLLNNTDWIPQQSPPAALSGAYSTSAIGSTGGLYNGLTGRRVGDAYPGTLAPDRLTSLFFNRGNYGQPSWDDIGWYNARTKKELLYSVPRSRRGGSSDMPPIFYAPLADSLFASYSGQTYRADLNTGSVSPFPYYVRTISPSAKFTYGGGNELYRVGGEKVSFLQSGESIGALSFLSDQLAIIAVRGSYPFLRIQKLNLDTLERTTIASFPKTNLAYPLYDNYALPQFDAVDGEVAFLGTDDDHPETLSLYAVDFTKRKRLSYPIGENVDPSGVHLTADGARVQVETKPLFSGVTNNGIWRTSDLTFRRTIPKGELTRDGDWVVAKVNDLLQEYENLTAYYLPTGLTVPLAWELEEPIAVGPKIPMLLPSGAAYDGRFSFEDRYDPYLVRPTVPARPLLAATTKGRRGGGIFYSAEITPANLGEAETWLETRLDGGAWQRQTKSEGTIPAPDGLHALEMRAVDAKGRMSDVAVRNATADSVRPGLGSVNIVSYTTQYYWPDDEFDVYGSAPLGGDGRMYLVIQTTDPGTAFPPTGGSYIRMYPSGNQRYSGHYSTTFNPKYTSFICRGRIEVYDDAGNTIASPWVNL